MNLNKIFTITASIFLVIILFWGFNYFFGNSSIEKANLTNLKSSLTLLTKEISINQDESGNYGVVTQELPFIGCNLSNSYLDNEGVQTGINKIKKQTNVICVSDGVNGEIKKWALYAETSKGKYWCVDEDGARKEASLPIVTAYCK